MAKTKRAKQPKKIVWIKANPKRSKVSVGIGPRRLFVKLELFGDARDRVLAQLRRWENSN